MREEAEDVYSQEDIALYRQYFEDLEKDEVSHTELDEEDYMMIVGICMYKQEYDKAEAALEDALDRFPNDDELLLNKVEMLAATERVKEAFDLLDEMDAGYTQDEERLALRAGLCMGQERYEEAEQYFRQYEAAGGDLGVAAAGMAQCLAVRGQRMEGFKKICQYLKLESESAEACNRFIVWVIEWEMLREALGVVKKMTAEQPYNKFLWKLLYELCESLEDYSGAQEANEYALAIDPDDFESHARRILYSDNIDASLVEDSFARFRPEMWNSEQRLYFYGVMADFYEEHNNPEKEMFYLKEMLKEPIANNVEAAALHYRVGTRIFLSNRNSRSVIQEAYEYFKKAEPFARRAEEPTNLLLSDVLRSIGQCRLLLGDDEGIEVLREAWRTCRENAMAAYDYFLNMCILGRYDKALEDVELGLMEEPKNHDYELLKGAIFYYTKQLGQAETWLKKAFLGDAELIQVAQTALPDIMSDKAVKRWAQETQI